MLPGVATPWPAAPPMPTAKSRLDMALGTAEGVDLRGRRKSTAPDRARSDSSGAARRQSTERSLRAASESAGTRCAALRALGASLDRSQPHPADERAPRVDGEQYIANRRRERASVAWTRVSVERRQVSPSSSSRKLMVAFARPGPARSLN